VGVSVGVAVGVGVGLGIGVMAGCAQYLPPVFPKPLIPPQMIISLPVQTAECPSRVAGALVELVALQLLVLGSYRPPVPGIGVGVGDGVGVRIGGSLGVGSGPGDPPR
jgi:hypothetical protein